MYLWIYSIKSSVYHQSIRHICFPCRLPRTQPLCSLRGLPTDCKKDIFLTIAGFLVTVCYMHHERNKDPKFSSPGSQCNGRTWDYVNIVQLWRLIEIDWSFLPQSLSVLKNRSLSTDSKKHDWSQNFFGSDHDHDLWNMIALSWQCSSLQTRGNNRPNVSYTFCF